MKVFQGEETVKNFVPAVNEAIRYVNSLKEGKDKYGLIHTFAYGSTIITKQIKNNQNHLNGNILLPVHAMSPAKITTEWI